MTESVVCIEELFGYWRGFIEHPISCQYQKRQEREWPIISSLGQDKHIYLV